MNESDPPIRLLFVEDSETDTELMVREFQRAGLVVEFARVQQAGEFAAALAGASWDVVICDHALPGFSADAALDQLRRTGDDLPFMLVSGTIPDRDAVDLMRRGAHDYLLKNNLTRLVPATMREIKEARERHQRRRAEQALRDSAERLRLAQDAAGVGVFDVDLVRDFATWTEQEEAIFGFAPGTFDHASATFWELLHPDDRELVRSSVDAAVAGHSEVNLEYRFCRRNDKALRWVALRGKAIYDETGQPVRMVGVNIDITDRKQAEEAHQDLEAQLRQAQKMEAIGRLSGGVAHDFNNLLTVILGNVSLIEIEGQLPIAVRESLDEIKEAAKRAANLTRQLLTFSRRQPMQLVNLDLNLVMADMVRMLQRILGEDIRIELQPAVKPALLQADLGMLEQVLLNLAVNARDAMPSGGRLTIGVDFKDISPQIGPQVSPAQVGRFVCLSVRDTGCGMSPEVRSRIFEPFFTTKDVGKGTGLGLATVYAIVQRHNGWIEVSSEVGQGTVFRVHLPRLEEEVLAASPDRPPGDWPVASGNATVLLVEDEEAVRSLVRTVLARHGYRVIEASSGIAALELWGAHREEIGLLLTDLVMPDGMGGIELAKRLCQDKPALPVIYTSGYSREIAGTDFPIQDGVNFLAKPFEDASLLRIVHDTLAARTGGAS